jgi:hypothetical protein
MPNQRGPGQKLMPVPVDDKFLRELHTGMKRAGYRNRSQFVRDAIVEKLKRAGFSVPKNLAVPRGRTAKAESSPKIRYPAHQPSGYELNERAESKKRR